MRIFFIGTVLFSQQALQKLVAIGAEVVGVATKEASAFNADFADLTPICEKAGIPYRFLTDLNTPESLEYIRSLKPDVLFCFGWSSLLKTELLNLAPMGVVGFHPAALPHNRGRHPLIWALALGLPQTASTFFFMDEGADTGDILSQAAIDIAYEDDAASLYEKMTQTALQQIETFHAQLESGSYPRLQQDHSQANSWRKRGRADGKIDFRMSSRSIYNLVRALTRPYVGAHVEVNGQDVKVWKVRELPFEQPNFEPGKVLAVENGQITVKTGDGAIVLAEHEFAELPEPNSYF